MALKIVINTLEEVPEALREAYVERDGHYVLDAAVDEHPEVQSAKAKVKEFRENNTRFQKERDEALARLQPFQGINLEEVSAQKARLVELEKMTGTSDPRAVQTLIAQQVQAAIAPYEQKERERSQREADMAAKLARKNVESALRDAATKAGVAEPALPDFLHRGLETFTFAEDRVVAKNADGSPVFSPSKPGEELSPEEWAFELAERAPHLFAPSSGGGAPGGSGSAERERGNTRWVDGSNPMEVGKNLEDIAAGRAKVANSR